MDITRVALLEMKPRLHDILAEAVARNSNLELVTSSLGPSDGWTPDGPDVLVQEAPDPLDPALPAELLGGRVGIRLLVIGESGVQAALYELRLMRRVLSNVSIEQLLDAIRFGVERSDTPEAMH